MTTLDPLFRRNKRRLWKLRELSVVLSSKHYSWQEKDRTASYVCIHLLNLIAEFNRSYYVFALNSVRTRSGHVISTKFPKGTPIEVALKSINMLGSGRLSRRNEPSWHTKAAFLDVVQRSNMNPRSQVSAAVSLPVRVLDDLPTARNFFAHRNEETNRKCLALGRRYLLFSKHPTDLLASVPTNRPVSLLEDWIQEVELVLETITA